MELSEQQQKAQEFLYKVYKKTWEDTKFKDNLISNPIETLNEFTGKKADLPKDKTIVVVDQTNPNHIYINIPAKPNVKDVELNENQLEMITGGADSGFIDWLVDTYETITNWSDHTTVI